MAKQHVRGKGRLRILKKILLGTGLIIVAFILIVIATLYWQAIQKPTGTPRLVAQGEIDEGAGIHAFVCLVQALSARPLGSGTWLTT